MGKTILGISAFYHDSAATLVQDGVIKAAAQEERFTRKKHDERFPISAIDFCLQNSGLEPEDLDYVAFYEKPLLKFDRLLETYIEYAPRGFRSFSKAIPQWLKTKLHHPREIRKALKKRYRNPILFVKHHMSHAASAFFPSPFEKAAIITLDGVGEWDTTSLAVGMGNRIEMLKTISFPHSIGLLFSAFTYFCGFRVNSGEYKLMGLAPYGKPVYEDLILEKLVDIKPDGSFALNTDYFTFPYGLRMTGRRFEKLLGLTPRSPEAPIQQEHMDLAASIQAVTEKMVLGLVRHAKEVTGMDNLCLAGGVAMNCVANGKIHEARIFKDIWIQPASGDAGGALGAALFTHFQLLNNERKPQTDDLMKGSFLGPRYANTDIEEILTDALAVYRKFEDESELLELTARLLAQEKVIGWFSGSMEFGPRALGGRSILGDPRSSRMQRRMNLKIKFRESFRPFAPSVLKEDVSSFFNFSSASPYMLMVAPVKEESRRALSEEEQKRLNDPDLNERVNVSRSDLPAVTHVDYSARLQTVDPVRHGRYYRLLREFKRQTGCGAVVNTSFNVRGEPIVNKPEEALQCFLATDMDALVLEDFLLLKEDQPNSLVEKYRGYDKGFEMD